jgi:hypothetical protein
MLDGIGIILDDGVGIMLDGVLELRMLDKEGINTVRMESCGRKGWNQYSKEGIMLL